MEPRKFLEKTLPNTGHYCLFAAKTAEDKRVQQFYSTIPTLLDAAQTLDSTGYDVYFALASLEEAGSRKVTNVKHLQSFFLDLDCGPTKDYPNQPEAIKALQLFCKDTGLPKPLLVNSGRGIHGYWFLDEPVSYDEWIPVAEKLKAVCASNKLLADPAVTADAARVLRIPGTHNYKADPPLRVHCVGMEYPAVISLEAFSNAIGADLMPVPRKHIPSEANAVLNALIGNKMSKFKDILDKTQRRVGCAQLGGMLKNQAEVSEPLWRAGLSIAKFCEDGAKAADILSKNHPEYSAIATINKMDRIKGPYRCATFDEYAPGICTGCPHWGKIKSPITLGQRFREATEEEVVQAPSLDLPNVPVRTYTIPTYPTPYFRGAAGGVYVRKTLPDGEVEEAPVYHNDLYVTRRIRDPEDGESLLMRLHLPKDGVREFTLPLTAVTSKDEFRKHMSAQGVAITRMEELMKYTLDWVNELQSKNKADDANKQFGWIGDGMDAFVLGNQVVLENEVALNPPASSTSGLMPSFTPRGTYEQWRKNMDFYNRDGFELHQYVVGTAFGSVLMQFSAVKCAALHLHSKESGIGKTTAMLAGATLWGKPDTLVLDKKDTLNYKLHRGEIYHSLPYYLDEITNLKPWEISELAYALTSGKQRGRLTGNANKERFQGEPWSLLCVTTGNASVIERLSANKAMPKAEAQRIMEVKVDRLFTKSKDKEEQDRFSASLENNYGHGGVQFLQYVMQNQQSVRDLVAEVQKRMDARAGLTSENRFWSAHVAHTLAGLILAKRLGLLSYDVSKVSKFAEWMLKANLAAVADMSLNAQDILNDYINEHWNNVLWIKSTSDMRKGEAGALDTLVVPEALPRGKLVARYETDIKRAYLVPKALRAWCVEHQINYGSLVQDLKDEMGAKKTKMRLSKGTHMQLPPTEVLVVDCSIEVPNGVESGTDA